jgi:ribosomal protein S18 acetylase RimI-like enzyme
MLPGIIHYMIKISVENNELPEVKVFAGEEWNIADKKHYGEEVDWEDHKLFIQAYEDEKLVGALELKYQAGVMHISDLIVDHNNQRKGIGQGKNLHKIYLETGETWEARKFYENLGYKKTGELPNHYGNQTYVQYSKILDQKGNEGF